MRVTDGILTNQFLYNFNNSLNKVSTLQEQLSSGKAINRPSDGPVQAVRSLKFKSDLTVNSAFQQNASDAVSWMSTSDGAMTSAENIVQSIQTLVQSVAVPNPTISYSAALQQLQGYINELSNLGNTQIGGRYLFSGQTDKTQPFTVNTDANGLLVVSYNGTYDGQGGDPNAGTVTMKVSPGAPDPLRDKINVDGQALYGTIDTTTIYPPATTPANQPQLFKDLYNIQQHFAQMAGKLANPLPPSVATTDVSTLSNDLGPLSKDEDSLLTTQTSLGARQSVYQTIADRLQADYVTIKGDLSTNQDLDVSKASIDFQTAQNVYNSALSVGARILPQSLVDYLK